MCPDIALVLPAWAKPRSLDDECKDICREPAEGVAAMKNHRESTVLFFNSLLGNFHRLEFDEGVESRTFCIHWSVAMDGAYDIFKKSSAKNAVWVETVQGFEQAKRRLLHYTSISDDEYLVFDAAEGQFIDVLSKAASV
jgi:hypothetical protein